MDVVIAGIIGALLGAVITSFSQYFWGVKTKLKESEFVYKEKRYKTIISLLTLLLYPERLQKVKIIRPDLTSIEEVKKELEDEYINSFLFSSAPVLKAFRNFLNDVNKDNLLKVVVAIRKDLWGKSDKLDIDLK